ncbi:MAG: hypothetical protein OEV40_15195 [Acidimicrobiia bacterium]|nr:hypothetical protein [Acidimicrobiia bacterium]
MTEAAGITPADIEAKFRDIQGQIDVVAGDSKKRLAVAGAAGAVLLMLIVYVLGRRAGKKKSTVVEIRRL